MRHVVDALYRFKAEEKENLSNFIEIENSEVDSEEAPVVKFTIQSDPISLVGVNGCQATDMLAYVKNLFESLNDKFPCEENIKTLDSLKTAIHWQNERTRDRSFRGVEGTNQK